MQNKELYHITVTIRDRNGKLFRAPSGHGNLTDIKFLWESWSDEHMEHLMRSLVKDFAVWMPGNQVWIEASVFNSISSTYMVMYSYYGSEDRFIKH